MTANVVAPYSKRIGQEDNEDNHNEAGHIVPCPLQGRGDEVKFRVESQQMPEFYTSQKNQESHEISQCNIYDSCIMETGEPVGQE